MNENHPKNQDPIMSVVNNPSPRGTPMCRNISLINRRLIEKTTPVLARPVILGALLVLSLEVGCLSAGEVPPSGPIYGTPQCPANWRGIHGTGVFPAKGLPLYFDEKTNVRWRTCKRWAPAIEPMRPRAASRSANEQEYGPSGSWRT